MEYILEDISILYTYVLTFDVEVDGVGPAPAHGVGGLAGVEAGVGGGQPLEHEAAVAHDHALPHVLPQLHALSGEHVQRNYFYSGKIFRL